MSSLCWKPSKPLYLFLVNARVLTLVYKASHKVARYYTDLISPPLSQALSFGPNTYSSLFLTLFSPKYLWLLNQYNTIFKINFSLGLWPPDWHCQSTHPPFPLSAGSVSWCLFLQYTESLTDAGHEDGQKSFLWSYEGRSVKYLGLWSLGFAHDRQAMPGCL